jgi:hypothetical protein
MPYIVENGKLKFVTREQLDAYNQANPVSSIVPAGGQLLNVTPVETGQSPEQILSPNTTNTSPNQTLSESSQPYSGLVDVPPGADPEVPGTNEDLIRLNDGANLGVPDEFGFVEDPITGIRTLPEDIPVEDTSGSLIRLNDGLNLGVPDEFGFVVDPATGLNVLPEDIEVGQPDGYITEFTPEGPRVLSTAEVEQATAEAAALDRARQQQTIAGQRRQINNGDWRVRLRLAPQSDYLYNAPAPGILYPLRVTDGVIFPYTPTISTAYKANYSQYDLTHSNYRGYFYQNSYVEPIQISAQFTAQNTDEANYLLAVISFFKSVTKMFYGQDAQRGAPPPLTYLTGLGEYQFNEHPCVVTQFNYTLPPDIDYIRAGSPNQLGLNQVNQRARQGVASGGLIGGAIRMLTSQLTKGAIPNKPAPPSLASNRPTYVPTKMEIQITLLPIQSRNQVSKQFSVKEFANGNLIKGGFW